MTDTPRIGIVLLNYRGADDTLACLDSLLASERMPYRVVIADNASPDGSLARLHAGLQVRAAALDAAAQRAGLTGPGWVTMRRDAITSGAAPCAWLTLLDNGDNRGFAAGNNPGLRLLLADPAISHCWLLNNDTELPPHSLGALEQAIADRPEIDLWGGTIRYHAPPRAVQALCGGALNQRSAETRHVGAFLPPEAVPATAEAVAAVERQIDYVLGACMIASRRWLTQVGLLNECYFLYYEELDWATRGRRLGLRLGYAPQLLVFHKEGASIGTAPGGGSPLSVQHLVRSRILYARQHLPPSQRWGVWVGVARQGIKLLLRGRIVLLRALLRGARLGAQTALGSGA